MIYLLANANGKLAAVKYMLFATIISGMQPQVAGASICRVCILCDMRSQVARH